MNYKKLMDEQTRSVFDASIATKILQHISRVRDSSHDGQARRWIWELIQNAKDASFPGEPVNIRVHLTQDELIFSHNGRPFSMKAILSIINQVSSKLPDNEETTGKFGTGFVTTHLLSEVVKLSSIISDVDENGDLLPYKAFEVALDRSGNDQEEILEAVNKAINIIENVDETEDVEFDKSSFNTSFSYALTTERCKEIANLGINDLKYSIVYALIFVKNISKIEIINEIENESKTYEIAKETKTDDELVTKICVNEFYENKKVEHFMLVAKQGKTVVATPIDKKCNFIQVNENTPRVFVDFPLIGSEEFPFPAVCNSSEFLPDEPRSFIPINDGERSTNSDKNKEILLECMDLYRCILKEASDKNYSKFYNVVSFSKIISRPDFNKEWIVDNIYSRILEYIDEIPVFNIGEYYETMSNIEFPMSESENEILKLGEIIPMIQGYYSPIKEDLYGWYQSFKYLPNADEEKFITLEYLTNNINDYLLEGECSRIEFVQAIYDAVIENTSLLKELNSGSIALIPDQCEYFNLHTITDIFIDVGIDDNFKESIELLNKFTITSKSNFDNYLIYESLVHKEFKLGENSKVEVAQINNFTNYINNKTNIEYSSSDGDRITGGFFQLICCCDDDCWFNFAKTYFPDKMIDKEFKTSEFYSYDMWRNCLVYMIKMFADVISECNNLNNFKETYFEEDSFEEMIAQLKLFIKKASVVTTKIYQEKIFPNQYNEFYDMDSLSFQEDNTSDDLKDIAKKLTDIDVPDYYENLLYKDLGLFSKTNSSTISNVEIANNISTQITKLFNEKSLSEADEDIQVACTLLLDWIQTNDEASATLFSNYYNEENRMKLLTPASASILSKKSKRMDKFLESNGFNSMDEFEIDYHEFIMYKNSKNRSVDTTYNEKNAFRYESYIDYSDEMFNRWSQKKKDEYARKVGDKGESFAFESLRQKWLKKGFEETVVDAQTLLFEKDDDKVELFFGDTFFYKQKGWDIKETFNDEPSIYYEVKATVSESRKRVIKLTQAQADNAYSIPSRFKVMTYYITTDLTAIREEKIYDNVLQQIELDVLSIAQDGMYLIVK